MGDLVLVKESSSNIERNGSGGKLEHERWTGPWKLTKVLNAALMIEVVMEGRSTRTRHVSPGGIKPFHIRSPDLRHPLADEFAQFAWSADFGLATPSVVAKPLYTLCDRRNVTSATGVSKWEYRGKYHDGKPSQWMAETEILSSFSRLQLDVFHALWNLYNPHQSQILAKACTTPPSRRRAQAVPNRYPRRERIGQRDHPGPGLRLPRPVLEGTVRGQRLGGAVTTRGAPNGRSTPGRHLGTQPPTPPRR